MAVVIAVVRLGVETAGIIVSVGAAGAVLGQINVELAIVMGVWLRYLGADFVRNCLRYLFIVVEVYGVLCVFLAHRT